MPNINIKWYRLVKWNELEVFVFDMQKQFIGFSKVHQIQESISEWKYCLYTDNIHKLNSPIQVCVFNMIWCQGITKKLFVWELNLRISLQHFRKNYHMRGRILCLGNRTFLCGGKEKKLHCCNSCNSVTEKKNVLNSASIKQKYNKFASFKTDSMRLDI